MPGSPHPSPFMLQELRYWIHFAEAAYYEMKTEDQLKQWLSAEGCDLLYASSENSPNAPVYFVAIQPERKELIVSLRGTMSVSDAVTDMIGASVPLELQRRGTDTSRLEHSFSLPACLLYTSQACTSSLTGDGMTDYIWR